MCSKPIKLRRPPPPVASLEPMEPTKRAKGSPERCFIGDGRLQKAMDDVLGPLGICSDLVDMISTFEFDYLLHHDWTLQITAPPDENCKCPWKNMQFIQYAFGLMKLSKENIISMTLRGSLYFFMKYNNSSNQLQVIAQWPLSRNVLCQTLSGSQRRSLKSWCLSCSDPAAPLVWVDYADTDPFTWSCDYAETASRWNSYRIENNPPPSNPFPCKICK